MFRPWDSQFWDRECHTDVLHLLNLEEMVLNHVVPVGSLLKTMIETVVMSKKITCSYHENNECVSCAESQQGTQRVA